METYLRTNRWTVPVALVCLALPAWAQSGEPVQPLRWVQSEAHRIRYKVPAHWRSDQHTSDTLTRVVYTCPENRLVLTVTKRKLRGRNVSARQMLDTLTGQYCPQDRLVFQTRYNRLSFWEATGTRPVNGRYETLVTVHDGSAISFHLTADCRLAYRRHEELVHQVFASVRIH